MKMIPLILTLFIMVLSAQTREDIENNLNLEMLNLPEILEEEKGSNFDAGLSDEGVSDEMNTLNISTSGISFFPLTLDTATMDQSVFGLQWGWNEDEFNFNLLNSDVVQIGEACYLYIMGKDSLLLMPSFKDHKFRKLRLKLQFQELASLSSDSVFKDYQSWCLAQFGNPSYMEIIEFFPGKSNSSKTPGEKNSWIIKKIVKVDLIKTLSPEKDVYLEFSIIPKFEKTTVKSKLGKFFK